MEGGRGRVPRDQGEGFDIWGRRDGGTRLPPRAPTGSFSLSLAAPADWDPDGGFGYIAISAPITLSCGCGRVLSTVYTTSKDYSIYQKT